MSVSTLHLPMSARPPLISPSFGLVGKSFALQKLCGEIARYAPLSLDILLLGASGTGKTTIARILHEQSGRDGKFRDLNVATLPETLIEAELFGSERGAFTGAIQKQGLFEQARGGTLFLDEIGELPDNLQAKLLKVVETKTIRRVGGAQEVPCDVRLIYATHRPLSVFREDFSFRIDEAVIRVPTLSERVEDIPLLVEHRFALAQEKVGRSSPFQVDEAAMRAFCDYHWPGNIRQLGNVVLKIALARGGQSDFMDGMVDEKIVLATIAARTDSARRDEPETATGPVTGDYVTVELPPHVTIFSPEETFDHYTSRLLIESYNYLRRKGLNHTQAALRLACHRNSLYARLRQAQAICSLEVIGLSSASRR